MRTEESHKAVRSSVTAALGFLTGILALLAMPGIAPAKGDTERVSVDSAGNQGNSGGVSESISADGRLVVFSSLSTNLVPGDTNGTSDVFVHARQTGTTERVSVASAGSQGDGPSGGAAISASGRFVAFVSRATNLVPGDTNGVADVFVHDRLTRTTERVSVDSAGNQANGDSGFFGRPAISASGRFVAFTSFATNLVPGDTNGSNNPRMGPGWDVFVHDRQTRTTERVSVDSGGIEGNHNSREPSISADGRFVAFTSDATNLVPGDTNASPDVFVRDRETGTTELVSVDSTGAQQGPNTFTGQAIISPSISADGRFVAFASDASNLVPGDTNGRILVNGFGMDVFVHDRQTRTTERVSVDSAGAQTFSTYPIHLSISAGGRYVAFDSTATNLVPGDTNGLRDVFVHDRERRTTERVSVGRDEIQAQGGPVGSNIPSISANGVVAFTSDATNLVFEDTNGTFDAFVRHEP